MSSLGVFLESSTGLVISSELSKHLVSDKWHYRQKEQLVNIQPHVLGPG